MFVEGVWTCCVTRSGAGCLSKNLQEGHVEQENLGLVAGSRADLPRVSGLFFPECASQKTGLKRCFLMPKHMEGPFRWVL